MARIRGIAIAVTGSRRSASRVTRRSSHRFDRVLAGIGEAGTFFLLVLAAEGCATSGQVRQEVDRLGESEQRLAGLQAALGLTHRGDRSRGERPGGAAGGVGSGSGTGRARRRAGSPRAGDRLGQPLGRDGVPGGRGRFRAGHVQADRGLEATARPARRPAPRGERSVLPRGAVGSGGGGQRPRRRTRGRRYAAICTRTTACRCTPSARSRRRRERRTRRKSPPRPRPPIHWSRRPTVMASSRSW